MLSPDLLLAFSLLDLTALGLMGLSWFVLGWWIESPRVAKPSVTVLMAEYRRLWMQQFVTRNPRMYDAAVLAALRQSTSFLASATMIALGGVFALIGNSERLLGVAADLTLSTQTVRVVEVKLLLVGLWLSHAFLKFLWSNRLFGYSAIMMSAVPNDPAHPLALPRARQAAEINIRAAFNFNRGLRATYFALAAMAWLLGAWALIAAGVAVGWLIWSREFASASRAVLLDPPPGA